MMYFLHGVLDGCASEQEAVTTAEREQDLPAQTGATLDGLRLVEDHILPLDPVEILDILHHLQYSGLRGGGKEKEEGREYDRN